MDKLSCMHAYVVVVEAKGFSSAARKTGLSKALLSKYVAQLENQLDVRLLMRTTRKVTPTTVGQAYYERCLPLLNELQELENAVQDTHHKPVGEIRISAPSSFAEIHLMAVVSAFCKQYPEVKINLIMTDRRVDIVEEGIDLALRIADMPDSSLVARRLAPIHVLACATPTYLQLHGEPDHPQALQQHRCIIDNNFSDSRRWGFDDKGSFISIEVPDTLQVNSARAVRELVLADNGIALCPAFTVHDDIRTGKLKVVLPSYGIKTFGLYAVYAHRRHLSSKVRLFIDALVEHFGPEPGWLLGSVQTNPLK